MSLNCNWFYVNYDLLNSEQLFVINETYLNMVPANYLVQKKLLQSSTKNVHEPWFVHFLDV